MQSGCGRGDVDGDGVTPLSIACIPGAHWEVLPGVWHTPLGRAGRPWYGDAKVVAQWQDYLEPLPASGGGSAAVVTG